MKHAVIDIETLGVGSRALIMEIGAVVFDPETLAATADPPVSDSFYRLVDPAAELKLGFEPDGPTLMWWLKQSEENRMRIAGGYDAKNAVSTHVMLDALATWCTVQNVKYIWGHGATFDPVILAEHFRRMNRQTPWDCRDVRDTRTLYALSNLEEAEWAILMVNNHKHHPVHDAWCHAKAISYCIMKDESGDSKANDDSAGQGALAA